MRSFIVRVQRVAAVDIPINADNNDTLADVYAAALSAVVAHDDDGEFKWQLLPIEVGKTVKASSHREVPYEQLQGLDAFGAGMDDGLTEADVEGEEWAQDDEPIPPDGIPIQDNEEPIPLDGLHVGDDEPPIPADGLPVDGNVVVDEDEDDGEVVS